MLAVVQKLANYNLQSKSAPIMSLQTKSYWNTSSCLCIVYGCFSVIVVSIMSSLWQIRITGLQKLPDGKDWLWGKWVLFRWVGPYSVNLESNFLLMGGTVFPPCCFSSVQFSPSVMSDSLQPHEPQHIRPPCPSPTPGVHPNPCPSSWWCHPTISPSAVPLSSCPQSFPALGSFPVSQLFTSGGQSIGVSASTSVLPMNNQDWSPLGWTGWISLQSKGLSRVFSNTIVQKHQFLCTQLSL